MPDLELRHERLELGLVVYPASVALDRPNGSHLGTVPDMKSGSGGGGGDIRHCHGLEAQRGLDVVPDALNVMFDGLDVLDRVARLSGGMGRLRRKSEARSKNRFAKELAVAAKIHTEVAAFAYLRDIEHFHVGHFKLRARNLVQVRGLKQRLHRRGLGGR